LHRVKAEYGSANRKETKGKTMKADGGEKGCNDNASSLLGGGMGNKKGGKTLAWAQAGAGSAAP